MYLFRTFVAREPVPAIVNCVQVASDVKKQVSSIVATILLEEDSTESCLLDDRQGWRCGSLA